MLHIDFIDLFFFVCFLFYFGIGLKWTEIDRLFYLIYCVRDNVHIEERLNANSSAFCDKKGRDFKFTRSKCPC